MEKKRSYIKKGRDYNEFRKSDGMRKAKPIGYRFVGDVYRKPTAAEIAEFHEGKRDDIYYEARPERSDKKPSAKKGDKFENGGSVGIEKGDLVFCKEEGNSGLVGLVISDKKEEDGVSGFDVYFRGYNGADGFIPESEMVDIIPNHLEQAENKGDLMHYPKIAKTLGIKLNEKYLQSDNEEYKSGGEISKQVWKHKHMDATAVIISETAKGYKVEFTDNSGKKPKTKIQFFDKQDFVGDRAFFEKVSKKESNKLGDTKAALKDIKSIERLINYSIRGNAHQLPVDNKMLEDYEMYLNDKEFLQKYIEKLIGEGATFEKYFDDDDFDENGRFEEFRVTDEYYINFKDGSSIVIDFSVPDATFLSASISGDDEDESTLAKKWISEFEKSEGWNMSIDEMQEEVSGEMKNGGDVELKAIDNLKGKKLLIYTLGLSDPISNTIESVEITPESYNHRYVTLNMKGRTVEKFKLSELQNFLDGDDVKVRDSKGETYVITLAESLMKEGGFFDRAKAMAHKGYHSSKEHVNKKVHDFKKKTALEVIDDTKNKVSSNKYKMALKGAEEIVGDKYKQGGELDGRQIELLITVPNAREFLLTDEYEYELTSFISKKLTKKWFGNGVFDVRLKEKIKPRQSIFIITVPKGKESLISADNLYDFTHLISLSLTKKWHGYGSFDVAEYDRKEKGGLIGKPNKDYKYFVYNNYAKKIVSGWENRSDADADRKKRADEFAPYSTPLFKVYSESYVKNTLKLDPFDKGSWYKEGGDVGYKEHLGLVKVKFENPEYNYETNVSGTISEADARKYFVGKSFDVGVFPKEKLVKVIDIEFFPKGTYKEGGEIKEGKNGYVAFYKGKQIDVYADSSYQAQQKAAAAFKAKKSYEVTVVLAEKEEEQVTHTPDFKNGGDVGKKLYEVQYGIGESKYVISYHDGVKKHKDGSDFYDIAIFKNKEGFEAFQQKLLKENYLKKNKKDGEVTKKYETLYYAVHDGAGKSWDEHEQKQFKNVTWKQAVAKAKTIAKDRKSEVRLSTSKGYNNQGHYFHHQSLKDGGEISSGNKIKKWFETHSRITANEFELLTGQKLTRDEQEIGGVKLERCFLSTTDWEIK